jgi:metal-responsive CopG/Arc/MetJ family transcriptional regulator
MATTAREHVTVRLSKAALDEVDALAAEMPCDRSTMLRILLKRGLADVQQERRRVNGSTTR